LSCQQVANDLATTLERPFPYGFQADPSTGHPLVRGAQWNDDPNNLLRNNRAPVWWFWMTDGKQRSAKETIDRRFYLQYRSHFGDLQFLHGMASRGRAPEEVQADLLEWARFAYAAATGEIPPDARLRSLEGSYGFIRLFSGTSKLDWTVYRLFANVGDKPGHLVRDLGAPDTPWMAAGALLHTVHDCYCESHVEREEAATEAVPANGPVRCFLDYSSQNSKCHGAKDQEPSWSDLDPARAVGPVGQGTWLLHRILARDAWAGAVEMRFREEIFALSALTRRADSGGFDRCD
jgi:hypothetical protein